MGKTVGQHLPAGYSAGDYPAYCDYCGVPWYRSQLRVDAGGRLYCPDEGAGLDDVLLQQIEVQEEVQWLERDAASRQPIDGTVAKEPVQAAPTRPDILDTVGREVLP